MNKKFSTLLAGVALFGAMSANAAVTNPVASLGKTNTELFQLQTAGDSVLVMNQYGTLLMQAKTDLTGANIANSLWCVEVTEEGYGKAPIFDFTNKATGQRLDIAYAGTELVTRPGSSATTDSTTVGGEISGWAFSSQYKSGVEAATLYSYFKTDSVIGLLKAAAANDTVRIMKEAATVAYGDRTTGNVFTKFTLAYADPVTLNAAAINTILGQQTADKGVKLTFDKDKNNTSLKNYFSDDAKFFADTAHLGSNTTDFVRILAGKRSDSAYVYVDTAYVNDNGEKFLGFATKQLTSAKLKGKTLSDTLGLINDQAKFLFTYWPSKDSLVIQVAQATYLNGHNTFAESLAAMSTGDTTYIKSNADKKNYVTVQDLVKADDIRIVTIYGKKETEIGFGFKGCEPVSDGRSSVADGLYFIMNKAGQYLASPIHVNGDEAQWVTVKAGEQLPAHMPAYQWVVLKTQSNAKLAATSPIEVTNREFEGLTQSIQLYKANGAKYWTATSSLIPATDSLYFVEVKEAEGVKGNAALIAEAYQDSLLGYKNIPDAEFLLREYNFKYLHPYATGENSKYLAKGAGKDSLLNVLAGAEDKDAFRLIYKGINDYGYNVTTAKATRLGIKQLYRANYAIQLGYAYMDSCAESKYGMNKYVAVPDSFYLKENNHYDGECYYAILKAADDELGDYKAGVTDDILDATLKVQPLVETRTSAFAIAEDKTPLYRRFNNEVLGESAKDGRDSLRFYESVRKEYLMDENNREGGLMDETVNYVGMWTADKATGLAFQVDTAWLGLGRGYIKPQYLISVAHNDFEGKEGIPCTEEGPHITPDGQITTDSMACKHAHPALPGFQRAKYLVSFQDSAEVNNMDKPYTDIKNGYVRVGFVEAIVLPEDHLMYVLREEFKGLANDKIDFAAMDKADSIAVANGGKSFIVDLSGDDHKNVTWSFRYVHPEKALKVTENNEDNSFLFESMAYPEDAAGAYSTTGTKKDIAPSTAAWLKLHNGCVVLTDNKSSFANAKTGGDGALIFNVENKENDELATDNEVIATSEVTVIAGNGNIQIDNAAGKKVVITNILGQTVANTVITSSNATIAAPAGVVVVAVEGEEAVKAIVK
ncbi:DUF6383 domain-containing protein [uncultured Parabacteroides sp.]|uniref:DUF6383 domain-containing protein n=1 Tax=uncultured Parabacteroides sp. TaxID=512312 RepID=UPI0028038DB8|nr:DUF6383 domain-containing protein [uncultured Parabacteroides sp.]